MGAQTTVARSSWGIYNIPPCYATLLLWVLRSCYATSELALVYRSSVALSVAPVTLCLLRSFYIYSIMSATLIM
jgi:hypothetical protein